MSVEESKPEPTLKMLMALPQFPEPIERYTCFDCGLWRKCDFAFDPYNTDGDCLAEK